ncbi:MAG: hypothetical protein ACRBCK_12535 [Alphaproteobacteria bacterium]
MTTAYACASGGVLFVPEKIEKTMPRIVMRRSNDNEETQERDQ